jgi:hypothetical protein
LKTSLLEFSQICLRSARYRIIPQLYPTTIVTRTSNDPIQRILARLPPDEAKLLSAWVAKQRDGYEPIKLTPEVIATLRRLRQPAYRRLLGPIATTLDPRLRNLVRAAYGFTPMDLSEEELAFLARHGLSVGEVLDGRDLSQALGRRRCADEGASVVLGSRCRKMGHRLRTPAGHCAQCKPANLAFSSRHKKAGFLYIAASLEKDLIKIGGTQSLQTRKKTLRSQGYAGASDWEILFSIEVERYGEKERKVQRLLAGYAAVSESYRKDQRDQTASEVFRCTYSIAKRALDRALKGEESK